jgi:membrane protein DedA with SNARE-associated domain/rhodanese-related sulfurtransferase
MNGMIGILTAYGYPAIFACVLAEQIGVPVPATPVLIAAGALAGLGRLNLWLVLLLAVAASLIGDLIWYYLGKMQGISVLRLLCKISLEPDSCVRRTNAVYSRHGTRWLLFAKFLPGVSTIAPPMAGVYRVNLWRFIAMDGGGATLWAGAFLFAGWCFKSQTDRIAAYVDGVGEYLALGLAGVLITYLLFKWLERKRGYRTLNVARIAPVELKQRIDSGESITIVDLRNAFEWREGRIPGSRPLRDEELDAFVSKSPEAAMLILYCSCPHDVSSAAGAALRLRRKGVKLIRTLEGGYPLWTQLGFPVEVSA